MGPMRKGHKKASLPPKLMMEHVVCTCPALGLCCWLYHRRAAQFKHPRILKHDLLQREPIVELSREISHLLCDGRKLLSAHQPTRGTAEFPPVMQCMRVRQNRQTSIGTTVMM